MSLNTTKYQFNTDFAEFPEPEIPANLRKLNEFTNGNIQSLIDGFEIEGCEDGIVTAFKLATNLDGEIWLLKSQYNTHLGQTGGLWSEEVRLTGFEPKTKIKRKNQLTTNQKILKMLDGRGMYQHCINLLRQGYTIVDGWIVDPEGESSIYVPLTRKQISRLHNWDYVDKIEATRSDRRQLRLIVERSM